MLLILNMSTLLKALFKFCTYYKIFIYFKRRYDNMQVRTLNNIIKIGGNYALYIMR